MNKHFGWELFFTLLITRIIAMYQRATLDEGDVPLIYNSTSRFVPLIVGAVVAPGSRLRASLANTRTRSRGWGVNGVE